MEISKKSDAKITEKLIENIIYQNLLTEQGCEKLYDSGLWLQFPKVVFRQMNLGRYGIADLVTAYKVWMDYPNEYQETGTPTKCYPMLAIDIIELKNEKIKPKHFEQIFRYKRAFEDIEKSKNMDFHIRAILIGNGIADCRNLFCRTVYDIDLYEFNINEDGISFKSLAYYEANDSNSPPLLYKDLKLNK